MLASDAVDEQVLQPDPGVEQERLMPAHEQRIGRPGDPHDNPQGAGVGRGGGQDFPSRSMPDLSERDPGDGNGDASQRRRVVPGEGGKLCGRRETEQFPGALGNLQLGCRRHRKTRIHRGRRHTNWSNPRSPISSRQANGSPDSRPIRSPKYRFHVRRSSRNPSLPRSGPNCDV